MKYLIYISGLFLWVLTSCGGKSNPNPETKSPAAAALVFPDQNAVCISGNVISKTQSAVAFKWNTAANTDTYDITIKNLLTGETVTQSSGSAQIALTLARNTPFSWYITSKSSKVTATAKSDTWKFYNAGDGVTSYAPFPADGISPAMSEYLTVPATGFIKLSWQGKDVDNDIVNYDVYFGTSATPPLIKQAYTSTSLDNITITANTIYYWKIVTRDSNNNTSVSDVFQFKTN